MGGQLISSGNLKTRVMEKESRKIIIAIRFWDTRAVTTQFISATSMHHSWLEDLRGLFKL